MAIVPVGRFLHGLTLVMPMAYNATVFGDVTVSYVLTLLGTSSAALVAGPWWLRIRERGNGKRQPARSTRAIVTETRPNGSWGEVFGDRVKFTRAGLTKLTPSELSALEEWLRTYTDAVAIGARSSSSNPAPLPLTTSRRAPSGSAEVIETCIEGEFEGWTGDTLFKLCNGQIWQQSEYSYTYEYAYRPDVIIYKTASGYRMKVEDVAETIGVKRLK